MIDEYIRKAVVKRIIDADTIEFVIDLGFDTFTRQKIRLADVDAWEVTGVEKPRGVLAESFVEKHIPVGSEVMVRSIKNKKGGFGRYLLKVEVMIDGEPYDLGTLLIDEGHAEAYPRKKG